MEQQPQNHSGFHYEDTQAFILLLFLSFTSFLFIFRTLGDTFNDAI